MHKGQYYYHSRRDDGTWKTTKQKIKGRQPTAHDFWNICPIVSLGWPDIRGYADVIQNNYSRENKLICIEAQGKKFYLNPNRDYICHKKVNNYQVTDVIEYGQTKEGTWYPKRVEDFSKSHTAYLETDPEFPEGIFDPENLPK